MRLTTAIESLLVPLYLLSASFGQECAPRTEFKCRTGQCIRIWNTCDGDLQCIDGSDEANCRTELLVDENFLIVADSDRRNLFQVGLDSGEMVPILPEKIQRPVAVVYDELTGNVYWTDVLKRSIGQYSLRNRPAPMHSLYTASDVLDGLALDGINQRLYFSDAGEIGKISSISTNGSQHRVLLQQTDMKPRAIVLDLTNRIMYWSDWGDQACICRANMDTGSDRVILVSGPMIEWPNALAIDFQAQIMYFGDAAHGSIQSARLDGRDRRQIYTNRGDHYFAFLVTPEYIFFTDWTERAVRRLHRTTLVVSDLAPGVFSRLAGITSSGIDFVINRNVSTSSSTTITGTVSTSRPTAWPIMMASIAEGLSSESIFNGSRSLVDHETPDGISDMVSSHSSSGDRDWVIGIVVGIAVLALVSSAVVVVAKRRNQIRSMIQPVSFSPGIVNQLAAVSCSDVTNNDTADGARKSNTYERVTPRYSVEDCIDLDKKGHFA